MAGLKYEELKTCLKKGTSSVETLKLCVEAFSKKDEAFHKAVGDMSFWCPHLFSLAFSDSASTRLLAVKCINLFMPKFVDRTKPYSDDWWKQLKHDITKKYAVMLAEKLDTFEDWDTLWKLCVSILDIELYQSTTLVNALLKVAEKAFRDKSLVIPAFSCWKHFITVYAKSPNVMFSSKQISLLITPLTAKSHYTLKYCEVKLEVWNTLIALVLDKSKQAVDVIINPFLSFLYGPLKMPFASSFPELVDQSVESYLLVLNNTNVFKYMDGKISSYLPKVFSSVFKSKKINEELILRLWKTFLVKVKQMQTFALLDNAVESISICRDNLNEENIQVFMKLIDTFMVEHPDTVFKHLHLWILSDKFLSIKSQEDTHYLELIIKGYENSMSELEAMIGHLFYVPLNLQRDNPSKRDICLSNLSELWSVICDTIHFAVEHEHDSASLSSDALSQLLLFPVECLYDKWCSRMMKQWRLICNDSISILPASTDTTEFGKQLIDNLIVTVEKHPKSLTSVVLVMLEICGILLSSILLKGSVKQAVPLMTCIIKLIEQIESVQNRHSILLNEALPKISLWSNLHVELNTDLMSMVETILATSVIGTDNTSLKLKNKIAKISRQIRSNIVQTGTKPAAKEVPSTPKSAIKSTSFMHRLDKAMRQKQNSQEDLKKLLTPEKSKKNQEDDEYVYIAPKTKVTPLTKHQKEMMKSRRVLPAMINGFSQDTQSQDSQALDVILSVGGEKPVKRTLDSTKEDAIDELLDEFETKDDSIFDRVANSTVIKQEPKISGENGDTSVPPWSPNSQKTAKSELDIGEKPADNLETCIQGSQTLNKESSTFYASSDNLDAVKEKICSKILSLLRNENGKNDGNNLGKFFNILINEPHPALYLFHKLKEITEQTGESEAELQLIYKEFSTDDLKNLFNTLDAAVKSESESSIANKTENESKSKGIQVSKNCIAESVFSDTTASDSSTTNVSEDSSLKGSDATQRKSKSDSEPLANGVPTKTTESGNPDKSDESIFDSPRNLHCDYVLSPAFRARRKINPPKRFSPSKKEVSRTPTKVSPKLLRSRKSLGLPTTQSSPVRTKPRRSLNMKAQVSSDGLSVPVKTFNASDKNKLSALGEESGKKAKDRPDDAENIEKTAKLVRKKVQPEVSEPMDVDESENVCSKTESGEKSDFSEAATVCLEGSNVKMQKHQVDNKQDFSTKSNNENSETNKCVNNKEELNNETGHTPNKRGSESVEMDTLNNSAVNLDESRDFTLMLIKTPKSNGDISVMESSPEIFDSVNLNNTSDEFKTASENENENRRTGEESDEDINQKRTLNSGSRFKIKNSMLLKSALNNGFSPLKQRNGLSSASKEKSFLSLDSWITRTSKQSENSAKSAEFSQNSDIIESSQPDVSLSSSKFNKSVSVSSPIMTQFNSSIYCSPRSVVENEPGSGSKPKVARKLILNERESSGADSNEKSKSSAVNNENSYEPLKKSESDDSGKLSSNFNHKLSDNTKVLSPRNQYLGRTALMMNMAIGDDNKVVQTPSSKSVQKDMSVTPSPPRTPQHLNSVGKKWVKRRYVSDAPPTPSILKKSRNDENESRPKGKLVSFSDPPMIEVLEFSTSDPQKDTVYGLDIAGLTENTQDDISTQGSIPEMPEVSSTKTCYPNLSLCRDPINGIVPLLVEPKWHSTLNEKFESRNIMTIGCLASLTELQACQLPVGEPRLFRIKNALKEYHRSLQEKRKEAEEQRKYERSKFMCKFLMPAGIDKAIKEIDEPPKREEKIVAAVSEGPEENDVIASSINIDSGIDDNICETEIVKPVFSVDVVPTSQTDITNRVNDFGVTDVSPSENEISCSLKKNTNQDPEVEESPPSLNSIVKELKSVIQQSKTGKDALVSSRESRTNNSDGLTVAALDNVEKHESLSNKEDIVETTEVVEDSNQISAVSLSKTNEEENRTVKSARSSEAVLKELVANEKIEESQSIFEEKVCDETSTKPGLTQVTIKSRKKRLSRTVIDKDRVTSDNVEESGQGIDSKNSEVVTKSDNKELHPILKIRSDREINLIKMSNNTIKLKTKQLSTTVSDKDKVSCDSVEESGEGKGPEDSEVVMETNDNELHSVAEIKSDRELDPVDKSEFNDTVTENHIASQEATSQKAILSCSSDKSEINGKDNHERSDLRPVENTKFESEDDSFDKMLKCEQPSNNISGVASQSPVKESSQNSESIVQASPVPKSGKSNVRSLRKRKAAMDHDMPKSKVLRSTGSKKFNKTPVQEGERPASVDDCESNKIESTNSSNIFEKPPEEKKSVLMPLEKDSPLSTTPNNIEIPVECCDETSLIQASTDKSGLNTVASGSNTVESELSGFKKLGNLYTVSTETKKELLKIFFRDENASASVSLLKDAVLDRLDVKRELFNYLLNDKELGVKFCVKF